MTNGRLWRLYSPRAQSRASNYYEIELEEALGADRAPSLGSSRRIPLLLAAVSPPVVRAHPVRRPKPSRARCSTGYSTAASSTPPSWVKASKERVFEQIFRLLAEGFVANIREREGADDGLFPGTSRRDFPGRSDFALSAAVPALCRGARPAASPRDARILRRQHPGDQDERSADAAGSVAGRGRRTNSRSTIAPTAHALMTGWSRLFRVIDRGRRGPQCAGLQRRPVYQQASRR